MKNSFAQEVAISVVLVALLGFLLNPFGTFMPDMMIMTLLAILAVVFAAFAVFVWKESAADEREGFHRLLAGRSAFLAGSAVLVLGIIVQSLNHALDPWLLLALAAMILVKVAARARAERDE